MTERQIKTGRQQNSLRLFCFLPVSPLFRRRVRGFLTEEQTPSLRVARSCVFSPVSPHFRGRTGRQQPYFARSSFGCFLPVNLSFGRTGDNALLLTAFALAFSPVNPLSVAAFAALKVSFSGACPGKDEFYYIYNYIYIRRQRCRCGGACPPSRHDIFFSCGWENLSFSFYLYFPHGFLLTL